MPDRWRRATYGRRSSRAAGPTCVFNPRLYLPDGRFLACPDVYDASGVCLEVDSREHHFGVESWEATMRRHALHDGAWAWP